MRAAASPGAVHSVYEPSLCFIAQGAKTATLAGESYRYDPFSYLVTSSRLPIIGHVTETSPEKPYFALHLALRLEDILEMDAGATGSDAEAAAPARAIFVNRSDPSLLDALLRLLRLLDTPEHIPALAPLITREIVYRVLQSENGRRIRQFAVVGSHAHSIAEVVRVLQRDFAKPLRVESLAREANLSVSALHKHFKAVTGMSPLQYQKSIRLHEARRMLFAGHTEAAEAAFQVGYESPSQFSREYARLFGRPPISDAKRREARYR
jgi:AraC-like DNA-binding protein